MGQIALCAARIGTVPCVGGIEEEFGMPGDVAVEVHLPPDIAAALRNQPRAEGAAEKTLRVALAIGLFAQQTITLAKAAALAGMSRLEFGALLRCVGFHAYEYTETECRQDLEFGAAARDG